MNLKLYNVLPLCFYFFFYHSTKNQAQESIKRPMHMQAGMKIRQTKLVSFLLACCANQF